MLCLAQAVMTVHRLGMLVWVGLAVCAVIGRAQDSSALWAATPAHVPAAAITVVGEFINEIDALAAAGHTEAPAGAERRWELRLRVSNPTTTAVAVFWTDSYLVLPTGDHVPLVPLTLGSLPSSIPPGSSAETRFRFEAELASEDTVGVSLIWMGCCQAESAQWTWRLVRSRPLVEPTSGPRPETDGSPWAWGWILVGGILAAGLIAILLGL